MIQPVSFKLAKLLKEKGFGMSDEDYVQSPKFYEQHGNYIEYDVQIARKYNLHRTHLGAITIEDFKAHLTMVDNSLDNIYIAPTIAEVIMWLYEKHSIWISVYKYKDHAADVNDGTVFRGHYTKFKNFNSPTEAYEAAINYVLTKLI